MKKSTIILLVILGVIVIGAISLFVTGKNSYNRFVDGETGVDGAWAQVEVQYQRRMDLIPNLVATVRGYAEHESSTFENVTRARAGLSEAYNDALADSAATPGDEAAFRRFNRSQQRLNEALSIYVNAVHEAYPTLQANQNFMDLQAQLEGTENRIAVARDRYTRTVQEYNRMVRSFPANIFAGFFGFGTKPQFEADARASQAPRVSF